MPLIDARRADASPVATRLVKHIGLGPILALALMLRLAALAVPAVAHPDEVFQYLETAHRIVFGFGVVTWEWRAGMRGWLLPLLVAGPMRLGALLAPGGNAYLVLPKLASVALSLTTVTTAWALGGRLSRAHAIAASLGAAVWYEAVYYAPHILSETASIAFILPAATLLLRRDRWSARRLFAAGALLGVAASLRFQHGPAIAVLAVATLGARPNRAWAALALGLATGLLPSALADWTMGTTPYAWLIENVRQNVLAGRAVAFGDSGIVGFVGENEARWGLWIVPALWLAARGARRYPALAWTAAANLGVHMVLAHKEYRFVLLSSTILVLLAAIGTVDQVRATAAARGAAAGRDRARLLLACWLLASLSIAAGGFRSQWTKFAPALDAAIAMRGDPAACGLAVYRLDLTTTGGYAYLHRPISIAYLGDEEGRPLSAALRVEAPRFNRIMAAPDRIGDPPAGFSEASCAGTGTRRVCLYRRPGGCADAASSRYEVNVAARRLGL